MKQIDLDDLPPRIAHTLAGLEVGQELTLVQGGVVVARLRVVDSESPAEATNEPATEQDMKEVMEHFNAMIHDEF
jgi:antitoxin (DNA-binding transcriptional repressor) of toxin-antitoxin stability system